LAENLDVALLVRSTLTDTAPSLLLTIVIGISELSAGVVILYDASMLTSLKYESSKEMFSVKYLVESTAEFQRL
jgi:hypothetical protein